MAPKKTAVDSSLSAFATADNSPFPDRYDLDGERRILGSSSTTMTPTRPILSSGACNSTTSARPNLRVCVRPMKRVPAPTPWLGVLRRAR